MDQQTSSKPIQKQLAYQISKDKQLLRKVTSPVKKELEMCIDSHKYPVFGFPLISYSSRNNLNSCPSQDKNNSRSRSPWQCISNQIIDASHRSFQITEIINKHKELLQKEKNLYQAFTQGKKFSDCSQRSSIITTDQNKTKESSEQDGENEQEREESLGRLERMRYQLTPTKHALVNSSTKMIPQINIKEYVSSKKLLQESPCDMVNQILHSIEEETQKKEIRRRELDIDQESDKETEQENITKFSLNQRKALPSSFKSNQQRERMNGDLQLLDITIQQFSNDSYRAKSPKQIPKYFSNREQIQQKFTLQRTNSLNQINKQNRKLNQEEQTKLTNGVPITRMIENLSTFKNAQNYSSYNLIKTPSVLSQKKTNFNSIFLNNFKNINNQSKQDTTVNSSPEEEENLKYFNNQQKKNKFINSKYMLQARRQTTTTNSTFLTTPSHNQFSQQGSRSNLN